MANTTYITIRLNINGSYVPVLFRNSKIVYMQLKYVVHLAEITNLSYSSLTGNTVSIKRFLEYWDSLGNPEISEDECSKKKGSITVIEFLSSLRKELKEGNLDLGWQRTIAATVNTHLRNISRFLDWCDLSNNHYIVPKNTIFEKRLSNYEHLLRYREKLRTSMLGYLYTQSREGRKRTKRQRIVGPLNNSKIPLPFKSYGKAFPPECVWPLIFTAKSSRDRLLYLFLAFGGTRISEALCMWSEDFLSPSETKDNKGRIWLYDPINGLHKVRTNRKSLVMKKRADVLHDRYGLKPREQNPKDRVGWKGIALWDKDNKRSEVIMPPGDITKIFWSLYSDYITRERLPNENLSHPYFFINLRNDEFKGEPMKYDAVNTSFRLACNRIGLSGYGIHSLRHHYGYLMASSRIPRDESQYAMRHMSMESTDIYRNKTPEQTRSNIEQVWEQINNDQLIKIPEVRSLMNSRQ